MPRRHRAARERAGPPVPVQGRLAAPEWALVSWADVRAVTGDKAYRCPGCDHEIRRGVAHLVVVPNEASDERRHWHTECWRRELRMNRGH